MDVVSSLQERTLALSQVSTCPPYLHTYIPTYRTIPYHTIPHRLVRSKHPPTYLDPEPRVTKERAPPTSDKRCSEQEKKSSATEQLPPMKSRQAKSPPLATGLTLSPVQFRVRIFDARRIPRLYLLTYLNRPSRWMPPTCRYLGYLLDLAR